MLSSSIVNGLEKQLTDQANVLRIDLLSQLGKDIANQYDANAAGTNILLDRDGNEVHRTKGIPKGDVITELVSNLQ